MVQYLYIIEKLGRTFTLALARLSWIYMSKIGCRKFLWDSGCM